MYSGGQNMLNFCTMFFQLWKPMDSQPVCSSRHWYWPALAKPWFPFTQPIYPPFPIFLPLWCLCRIGKASAYWAATPRIRRHASNVVRLYNNRPPIVASTNAFPDRRAIPANQRSLRSHLFFYIDWVLPNTLRSKLSIVYYWFLSEGCETSRQSSNRKLPLINATTMVV